MIESIQRIFPGKAWAYSVEFDKVQIGVWNGSQLKFKDGYSEDNLLELRVFNNKQELRVVRKNDGFVLRDSLGISGETLDQHFFVYGTSVNRTENGYSALNEQRGAELWFPVEIKEPVKLGIRNYYRFNPVPVLHPCGNAEDGIVPGQGALEFFDYAYTGFYYLNHKAVVL